MKDYTIQYMDKAGSVIESGIIEAETHEQAVDKMRGGIESRMKDNSEIKFTFLKERFPSKSWGVTIFRLG